MKIPAYTSLPSASRKTKPSRKSSLEFICLLLISILVVGCSGILAGSFSEISTNVPELLYANNGTDYVTFWDNEKFEYRTYNQRTNIFLEKAIFTADGSEEGKDEEGVLINTNDPGLNIFLLTHLKNPEIKNQLQFGCKPCHINWN